MAVVSSACEIGLTVGDMSGVDARRWGIGKACVKNDRQLAEL